MSVCVIYSRFGQFVLDEYDIAPLARAKVFETRAEAEGEARADETVMALDEARAIEAAQNI